ncbi:SET domain-containing protein-lysine N-methyltransferase [Burkholderia ambifaria]|uniref:SET domain-containing protein-lysine N-methyltransferase n=1 Tax=Burkholderia ambifaria TaxID=152480 RepID=UPI00158EE5C8|nr:SET domain-containing protein-lysine N-methyltransferase [Burkholderia ambifaria]
MRRKFLSFGIQIMPTSLTDYRATVGNFYNKSRDAHWQSKEHEKLKELSRHPGDINKSVKAQLFLQAIALVTNVTTSRNSSISPTAITRQSLARKSQHGTLNTADAQYKSQKISSTFEKNYQSNYHTPPNKTPSNENKTHYSTTKSDFNPPSIVMAAERRYNGSPYGTTPFKEIYQTAGDFLKLADSLVGKIHLPIPIAAAEKNDETPIAQWANIKNPTWGEKNSPPLSPSNTQIRRKQDQRIIRLLKKKTSGDEYSGDVTVKQRVCGVIDLITTHSKGKEFVARCLENVLGNYGGHKTEPLPQSIQDAVINDWLSFHIFGGELLGFLTDHINDSAKRSQNLNTSDIKFAVNDRIDMFFAFDSSPQVTAAKRYIFERLINHAMPLYGSDRTETQDALPLNDLEWGYIHAGIQFARANFGREFPLSDSEASALGNLLSLLVINDAASPWFTSFFLFPATIRYVSRLDEKVSFNDDLKHQAIESFFSDIEKSHNNNPLQKFQKSYEGYKTRPELAKKIIDEKCPNKDVTSLLNGATFCGTRVPAMSRYQRPLYHGSFLPNVNDIYYEQNEQIANDYADASRALILTSLSQLSKNDANHITSSEIKSIDAEFSAFDSVQYIPRPPSAIQPVMDALTVKIKDNVDLFAATHEDEERIYALNFNGKNVDIVRIDRNIEKYYDLMIDNTARFDNDYALKIFGGRKLKQNGEGMEQLIDEIVANRRTKFLHQLNEHGYEKTGLEKAGDILLSLVPGYTCISDLRAGRDEAILSCLMDVATVILPSAVAASKFAGRGVRFGAELAMGVRAAARTTVQEFAMGNSVKGVLAKSGETFQHHALAAAQQTLNRRELLSLGVEALRAIDPGVELLGRLGKAGINRFSQLLENLKNINKDLESVLSRLQYSTIYEDAIDSISYGKFREFDIKIPIQKLGGDKLNGGDICVVINPETGEAFGKKYTISSDGILNPISVPLARRLKNIKEHGLSGRGAPNAAQQWTNESLDSAITRPVTPDIVRQCYYLGANEIHNLGGISGLARRYSVSPETLAKYFQQDGTLTLEGREMLDLAEANPSRDLAEAGPSRVADEQPAMGSEGSLPNRKRPAPPDPAGSEPATRPRKYERITKEMLRDLRFHRPENFDLKTFAVKHNLNPKILGNNVKINGELTGPGLLRTRNHITVDIMQELLQRRPEERTVSKLTDFAELRDLDKQNLYSYFDKNGKPSERARAFMTRRGHPIPEEVVPGVIKQEPDTWMFERPINNNLPILQDSNNPAISVLLQHEGPIESIRVTGWGNLKEKIDSLPYSKRHEIKGKIIEETRDWLRREGNLDTKFNDIISVSTPLDNGPTRGQSTFAARDIRQFEVLGPYSGKLHLTDESLRQETRHSGRRAVLEYLWETRSGQRTVSGLMTGNVLSLVNTSKIPGKGPAWGNNNVSAIRAGKSLTIYVANEDIPKGTELLVDYGDAYNPSESEPIKQEQ